MFRRTHGDIELAKLAGLIDEDETIVCQVCDAMVVFFYIIVGEEKKVISCEDCLRFALSRTMM
jgi:hypothetical protein